MPTKHKAFFLVAVLSLGLFAAIHSASADCTVNESGSSSQGTTQIPSNCSGTRTLTGNSGSSPSYDLFRQEQGRAVGEAMHTMPVSNNRPFYCVLFDNEDAVQ